MAYQSRNGCHLGLLSLAALLFGSSDAQSQSCIAGAADGACPSSVKSNTLLQKGHTKTIMKDTDDCEVSSCDNCQVLTLEVAGVHRCYTLYTPTTPTKPESGWPVVVYFHGMGGTAARTCSASRSPNEPDALTNLEHAEELGFALICADSDEDWQFPTVTGTVLKSGSTQGEVVEADPGVGGVNKRACSADDTADAVYVSGILDAIDDNGAFDSERIYFMGFSQGAMMTTWASTCFADRIRGASQAGSGLKVAGDGINIPGAACATECDACEFFPIQPGSVEDPLLNVVGEELKWCQYAGCSDYLLGSIFSMDQYLTSIGAPHAVQHYDGPHEAPGNWFPMIAQCHGWPNAPAAAGSGDAHWVGSCADVEGWTAIDIPVVDGSGCDTIADGSGGGGGGKGGGGGGGNDCSETRTTNCCGDKTCGGPETAENCPADCA